MRLGIFRSPDLARLMKKESRPLVYPPGGIGLISSAKSACTTAVLWYFAIADLLDEAVKYDPWPHKFRIEKLLPSEVYQGWLKSDLTGLLWVRVIRDPYLRAVSSYRHVLRHDIQDAAIHDTLGISITDRGLSFVEFLEYLQGLNVAECNPHLMQQWHPIERYVKVSVVNADRCDLLQALYAFADPGATGRKMLESEIERIARQHHSRRLGPSGDCSTTVLRRQDAQGAWPDYIDFLSPPTRRLIERIYTKDLTAYARFLSGQSAPRYAM